VHLVDFGLAALGPGPEAVAAAETAEATSGAGASTDAGAGSGGGDTSSGRPSGVEGTARYSSAAADAGRAPTYADDLEAVVFSMSYLRAGTTPWVPLADRGNIHAVLAAKAGVTEASLARDADDARWLWELLCHARALPWGSQIDLATCRGVVRRAFGAASGGRPMRDVLFDWQEVGVLAVNQPAML